MEYQFRVSRVKQAGRIIYGGTAKFGILRQMMHFASNEIDYDERNQRKLDEKHATEIGNYVANNREEFIIPPLVLHLKHDLVKFAPFPGDPDSGLLQVPLEAVVDAIDGQHRGWSTKVFCEKDDTLDAEGCVIDFRVNLPDRLVQQFFKDTNFNGKKVPTALSLYFEQRDPDAQITRAAMQQIELFRRLTEMGQDTIPKKSTKLFTFNALFKANQYLLCAAPDNATTQEQIDLAVEFWNTVIEAFPLWTQVLEGKTAASEVRDQFISARAISLMAIARLGAYLIPREKDWAADIRRLEKIDWNRKNRAFINRVIFGGSIKAGNKHITALLTYLKTQLDIPMTDEEKKVEKEVRAQQVTLPPA